MKTTAFGVENLCVPCGANCRYCLLSSCRRATGVDYARGKRLAARWHEEMAQKRPEVNFFYYIGYCMDTPELLDHIRFCREIGSPGGRLLQANGLKKRTLEEWRAWICGVRDAGIETADLTFYGDEAYHDAFAGRPGDWAGLMDFLRIAWEEGLVTQISLPLLRDNQSMAEGLVRLLSAYEPSRFFIFLPHGKGRGWALEPQRLTKREFEALPPTVLDRFSTVPYRTEAEWIALDQFEEPTKRTLVLSLTPQEMDRWERASAEEALEYLEQLDDQFLSHMPDAHALARLYGDPANAQMFRLRDLIYKWQRLHWLRCGDTLPDLLDESKHFSLHSA